jgi:hypothetical protein
MAQTRIFISYRRDDSAEESAEIEDVLERSQGRVFRDVSAIQAAERFPKKIKKALDEADYVVVVIGKSWLDARDESGDRRIDNSHDFVRREISYGLTRLEGGELVHVIPVLVQGAKMPRQSELPDDLYALAEINAHRIRNKTFEEDVLKLSDRIDRLDKEQTATANGFLDELDELADFSGGLDEIVSVRPSAAGNPTLRGLPELAIWQCSILSSGGYDEDLGGERVELRFETDDSGAFEGELLQPRSVEIEGEWRLGMGRQGSLVMILSGSTFDGDNLERRIPIERKAGKRSYTGRDDLGRFYRLEWLQRAEGSRDRF